MVNVPKSYIWGLEGDLIAEPIRGLTISASGSYLRSKVSGAFATTSDGLPVYNSEGYTGDFKGSELPFTPKFNANADVQYQWPVNQYLQAFMGGSLQYQSSSNATFHNATLLAYDFELPSYKTVDVRLGLSGRDDSWKLTIFGRNIFNEYYTSAKNFGLDTSYQIAGRPATYGLSLRLRYGG